MILFRWLISAITIMIISYIVPGIHVAGFWTALILALVLGLFNAILRPLLIILTLPVTILTLGLFTLVINAGIFLLASTIVKGFTVEGFGAAFLGSLMLWLLNWAVNTMVKN